MSSQNIPDGTATTKPCVVCAELINENAQKCVKCHSYQNWRRYVTLSSTLLSLLVALVSVSAIGIPVILNSVKPSDAVVDVSIIARPLPKPFKIRDFKLFATNAGTKAAYIDSVIEVREVNRDGSQKEGAEWKRFSIAADDVDNSRNVVEPGSFSVVRVQTVPPDHKEDKGLREIPHDFEVRVTVVQFDQSRTEIEKVYLSQEE